MKTSILSASILACFILARTFAAPLEVKSPDGRVVLAFEIKDRDTARACPVYRISWQGKPVIEDSRLGLELKDGPLGEGVEIVKTSTREQDSSWKPVCGERSVIRDRFKELTVELQEQQAPSRQFGVTFRVYDEGVGFAYTVPKQPGLDRVRITGEQTEFRFAGDYPAWATYEGQGVYQRVPLSDVKPGCERPLVIEMGDGLHVALAEARLVDYARMKFAPLKGVPHSLEGRLDGPVEGPAPLTSPWRVVMVAESPGRLLENNFIISNLNDPCAIADTSWIKPGKAIREGTLTTEGGRKCVDFAVKRGLQYVEYDAGWYGPENDPASDARAVNVDPARKKGELDLQEVIRYADEHGIGIILYVNHLALERQLDELLPLYRKWGVKGIKFGFVNVGSQKWTSWLHEAVRKCADYQMMVDVHDEYRMTGYNRTYPNLMSSEGILGDEGSPENWLTLAYAFTRFLGGPADNTVCYYDGRVNRNASHAYQLAKPVCLFSPWQFLFWYDRPSGPEYGNEPELEFYNSLPTTWDETKVLQGKIGEYALIARRKGDDWFVGFMNSGEPRSFQVPLGFLGEDRSYEASIYSDDASVPTKTKVRIDRVGVTRASTLELKAGDQGGVAVRVEAK